jgi:glyoxylase-like metal-dependent hydrolase (beta-lactamase superfamily II)
VSDYEYEEILPGVVVVPYPFRPGAVVSMVLVKGEKLAIFDTGMPELMPQAIVPALAHLDAQVSDIGLVVNTHQHHDHIGGNAAIQAASGAPVWIGAGDADALDMPPDRQLNAGDVVDLGGGLRFEVVALPGHTAGHIGLYEPTRRLLVAADAVEGAGGTGVLPLLFHSAAAYRATLEHVQGMDVDVLILGHPYAWSGERRLVQRGADVRQFVADSLAVADRLQAATQAAIAACPDQTWECLEPAFLR